MVIITEQQFGETFHMLAKHLAQDVKALSHFLWYSCYYSLLYN